jgi:type I restriction enzyme R subunit
MMSRNFEFLRPHRPALSSLGGFAERYTTTDPSGALVKLRALVEQIVEAIYDEQRLPKPHRAGLNDLLNELVFTNLVPRVIQQKLHAIRVRGNKAAHGEVARTELSMRLLQEAFDVASWFHLMSGGGKRSDIPNFSMPTASEDSKGRLKREKRALLEKLARQEAELQQLLANLDTEREKRTKLERASVDELTAQTTRAEKAATELDFSEAQTRAFLIDAMLVSAGWDVGNEGADTDEVGQEVQLIGLPTPSGKGSADYVLWGDDGKPLAVIEAKRTAMSAQDGRTQAAQYADALEVAHGLRPVIFYTNGVEIFLWDDGPTQTREAGYPPHRVQGFYSKDSLEYLIYKRANARQLGLISPSTAIAGRMYQMEAVKRVTERFSDMHRKALITQATGTGKTRVAISIVDFLIRARWAKRILFLCDRRELRKQADNAFKEFLPTEPRVFVSSETASDRDKRIYLATYPAMIKAFDSFDVGFFDLIIADESHRSIYNKYRDIFRYFDALQVGLTATPRSVVNHDTYRLFGCEDNDPTAHYSIEDAINHTPPYLVPFRVAKLTTKFLRDGIKWSQMTDEQKQQYEEQVADSGTEYEGKDLDRLVFNRDTSRMIIQNLMDNGIRDAAGSLPGKTIIFARNHQHAVHLEAVFTELYPKYGGNFCRVIDNYDKRAEQLIDDFKSPDNELRIAISVDMLDTGIDVPEIVNLVFAKPVKSYVKFWQMIGRGTRLRADLFGPGKDKREFVIFDHWGNFEYFDEHPDETTPAATTSLMQRVFEARIETARVALESMNEDAFQLAVDLIKADINALKATKAIEVRDNWRDLQTLGKPDTLTGFAAATHAKLVDLVAPLMRWVDVRGHEDARRLDLLIAEMQVAHLQKSSTFADLKGQLQGQVDALRKNLNQVKAKAETIRQVRSADFWNAVDVPALEHVRTELRSIMKHKLRIRPPKFEPRFIDVQDTDEIRERHTPTFDGHELIAYRHRVEGVLKQHFERDPILTRIRAGHAVTDNELDRLARAVLRIDPQIDLKHLPTHINLAGDLHRALRSIVGLDAEAVNDAFIDFSHNHLELSAQQLRFLSMLKAHICANGGLEVDRLYEAPFTTISSDGIDGVFEDALIDELLDLITRFNLPEIQGRTA